MRKITGDIATVERLVSVCLQFVVVVTGIERSRWQTDVQGEKSTSASRLKDNYYPRDEQLDRGSTPARPNRDNMRVAADRDKPSAGSSVRETLQQQYDRQLAEVS